MHHASRGCVRILRHNVRMSRALCYIILVILYENVHIYIYTCEEQEWISGFTIFCTRDRCKGNRECFSKTTHCNRLLPLKLKM